MIYWDDWGGTEEV